MNLWIAGLMFPALFLLIFQGMPVAFALILPAFSGRLVRLWPHGL